MPSVVVTGGARGVGLGIARHLRERGDDVVVLDLASTDEFPCVQGSASDVASAERARDLAVSRSSLTGWVNNAAVFADADLHSSPSDVRSLVDANLAPAIIGSATAVSAFISAGIPGSIVNVSSHQA